jgi:hypothetical protein
MCPGTENLIKNTEQRSKENIDNISYRQWMTTDRSGLWPSKSFMYPSLPDILWVPASKVLTKVDPETATSHTYVISEKETCCTTEKLEARLCRQ